SMMAGGAATAAAAVDTIGGAGTSDKLAETASDTIETVKDAAETAIDKVGGEGTTDKIVETASETFDTAKDAAEKAKSEGGSLLDKMKGYFAR
ncbi:MAG: hypothetical protein AAFY64_05420, partial [Pseudomonadota bacterium]